MESMNRKSNVSSDENRSKSIAPPPGQSVPWLGHRALPSPPPSARGPTKSTAAVLPPTTSITCGSRCKNETRPWKGERVKPARIQQANSNKNEPGVVSKRPTSNGSGYVSSASDATVAARLASGQHPPNRAMPCSSNDSLSKIYDEVGCIDQDIIGAPCSPSIRTSGVARSGYIQLQASFFSKRFSTSSLTSDQNIYNTFHSPDGTIYNTFNSPDGAIRCSTEHVGGGGGDFGSQRYSMTSSLGLASPPLYDAVRMPKRDPDDYSNSSSSCSLATYDHRTAGSAGKRSVTPESSCSPVDRPLRPACGVRIAELRANRKHDSDPASSSVSPSPEPLTTTATLFHHAASATPAISRMSSVGDGTYGQRQIGPAPLVVPRTPQLDYRRNQRSSLDVNVTYVEKFVEANQERCSNKRELAEEVRTMHETRQTRMRPTLNLQHPSRLHSDSKPPIESVNSGNLPKRVVVKSGNSIGPNVFVDAPEKVGNKETVLANAICRRTGLRNSAVSLNSSRTRMPLASPTSKSRFPASDFIPGSDVTSDDDSSCASGSCFSSESDKNGFRPGYRRIRSDVDDEISSEFEDNDHCNNYLKNSNSRACDAERSSPDTRMQGDRCSSDAKLPIETEDNLRCPVQPGFSYREPTIYATEQLNNIQRIGNFGQTSPEIEAQRKPDHMNNNNQDLCNTSTVSKAGYRSKIPSPNNLKTKVPTKSGLPNKVPLSPAQKRNTYVSGLAQKRTLKVPMSPTADRRPLNSPTSPCSSSSDGPAKPVGKRTPCLVRRTSNTVAPGLKRLSATCENVASFYSTPNSPPSPVDTTLKSGASLQQESDENVPENFDCIPEGTLVESSKRSHASVSPRISSISTGKNPFPSAIQRSTSMSKISTSKNSKCVTSEKTPARTDKRPSIPEDVSKLKKAPSRSDGLSRIGRATSHSNIFAKTKEIQKPIAHDSKETSRSTAVISTATKCSNHKSENSDSSKFNQSPSSSDASENAGNVNKDSIMQNKDMRIQNKDHTVQNKDQMKQNKDRSAQNKCSTTCKENVAIERNSVVENDRTTALLSTSKLKNPQAGRDKLANPRTESNVAHKETLSSSIGTHAKPMIPIKHVKPYSSTTSNYHHSSLTEKLAMKNKASSGTVLKSESRNIQQSSIDEESVQRTSADIDTAIVRVEPPQSAAAEVTLRSLLVPPGLLKQEEKDNLRSAGTFHSAKLDSTSMPASYCEPKTEEHAGAESNNVKDPDEREYRDSVSDDLKIGQNRSSPVYVADSNASSTGDCCNRHEESLFSRLNTTQLDPRTYHQIVEIRACSLSARNSGDGSNVSIGNVFVTDDPSRETDKFQEISPDQHAAATSQHQCKQIFSNDAETKSTSKDNLSGDGLGSYTKKSNESAERLRPEKSISESPKTKCTDEYCDYTHTNKMLAEQPNCDMVDTQASEGKLSGSADFGPNLSNNNIHGKRRSPRRSSESFPDVEVKTDEQTPVDVTSGIKITFNHDVAYCNSDKYIVAYQNEDTIVLKRAITVHDGDLRSSKLSIAEEKEAERCQQKPEVRLRPSKSPEYRNNLMSPRTELGNLPLSESGYDSWKSQSSESSSRLGKPHFDQFLRYGDRRKVNEAVLKRYSLIEFSSAQLENQRKFSMNCLSYQNIDVCKLSNLLSQTTTKNHKFSSTDVIQGESSSVTDNDADMYENSSVSEVNSIGTVCKHSHSQNMGPPMVEDERRPSSSEGNSLSLSASHCSSLVEDQYLPFMDGHFDNSLADAVFGSFPADMNDTFSKGNDSFSPSVSSSPSGSNADFLELELKEESLASGNVLLDPMQEMPPSNLFECDDDGLASMDQTSAAETSRTPGHLEDFSSKNYYKLDFGSNDGDLMNLDPEQKSPTSYNVDEFWLNFDCPVPEDTSALPVSDKSSNAQWIPNADGLLLSAELVTATKLQNFESVINARSPNNNRNLSVSFDRRERGTCYESVCDQLLESLQANLSDSENSPPLSLESSFNHKSNEFSYHPTNEEFATVENGVSSEKESSADRVVLNGVLSLMVKDADCEVTAHSNYRVAQHVDKMVTIETISFTENSNNNVFPCSPTTNAGESNSIGSQIPIHEEIFRDCQHEVTTVLTKSFPEENTSITTASDAPSEPETLTSGLPSENCQLDVAVEMNQVQTGMIEVEKFTTERSLGDEKDELSCDKSEPDGQDVNNIGNEKLQTPQITTEMPNTSNSTTNEHQRSDGTGQEIKRPDHTEPVPPRPNSPTHEPKQTYSITHELQKPSNIKYSVHRAYSTEHEPDRSESVKQELKRPNSLTHEIPVLFQKPFQRIPTVIRSSLGECELSQSSNPGVKTGLQKHTASPLDGRKNSATERTEVNSVKEAIKKFEEQNASHGDLGKKDVQTNVIGKKPKTGLRLYSPFSKVANGGINPETKHFTHETNSTQPTKLKPVVPHSDGNTPTHVPSSPSCTEPSSPKKSSANIPISLAQKPPSPKPKTLIPSLFHRASVPTLKHNVHEPLKQTDSKNNDNTSANASKTKPTATTKLPSSLPSPRTTARHNFFFNRRSSTVLK